MRILCFLILSFFVCFCKKDEANKRNVTTQNEVIDNSQTPEATPPIPEATPPIPEATPPSEPKAQEETKEEDPVDTSTDTDTNEVTSADADADTDADADADANVADSNASVYCDNSVTLVSTDTDCDGTINDTDACPYDSDNDLDGDSICSCTLDDTNCDNFESLGEIFDDFPSDPDASYCNSTVSSSIKLTLSDANDDDLICVPEGTYDGGIEYSTTTPKNIKLYCLDQEPDPNGNYGCIIDSNEEGQGIAFLGEDDPNYFTNETIVSGFNLTGGTGYKEQGICGDETSSSVEYGGGVYISYASPTLKNLKIYGNTAKAGAAISICDTSSAASLSHLTLTGNKASGNAGGIYSRDSSYNLSHSAIFGNWAQWGGGIYTNTDTTLSLESVTISGNYASTNGGGIFTRESDLTVNHSIVYANEVGSLGPDIYDSSSSTFNVTNSDMECSKTDDSNGSNISFCTYTSSEDPNGNLDTDPGFMDEIDDLSSNPSTSGNYSLQSSSSLIDIGESCTSDTLVIDLLGNLRCVGDYFDLGAYEYQE